MSIEVKFQAASQFHQRGELAKAKGIYEDILRGNPRHAESIQMLGLIAIQDNNPQMALNLMERALAIDSKNPVMHFNQAVTLQGLHQREAALASYNHAIELNPDFAEAYSNRSVIQCDLRQFAEAISSCDRALAVRPAFPSAWFNRGNAQVALNQSQQALESYHRAIEHQPDFAEAWFNCGNLQRELHQPNASLASYTRAIEIRPQYVAAYANRGRLLKELREPLAALADFEKILAIQPHNPAAHFDRALLQTELGQFEAAKISFKQVIARAPNDAEVWFRYGGLLRQQGNMQSALESYDRAILLKSDDANVHNDRGIVLRALGRSSEALTSCERAIAINAGLAEAHVNRAVMLYDLGQPAAAVDSYDRAITLKADFAEAWCNRGVALVGMKQIDQALKSFDRAIELKKDYADAHANKALALLLQGNVTAGWREHEWRSRVPEWTHTNGMRTFRESLWLGQFPIDGKTILLHSEQGLGDTIHFARYANLVHSRGARVFMSVQDKLCRLMSSLGSSIHVLGQTETPDAFDLHCPLPSLPLAFGITEQTIPANVPYLYAEPDRVASWRTRLGSEGFKIGICWQGSPVTGGRGRSFPLSSLLGIATMPRVRLISLQRGTGVEQLAGLPQHIAIETLGESFDQGADAFIDAAAVMTHLDLVITCDTSIAHLAGALGRQTWVAVKWVPDWRWMLDREDSPWYPTMRLFRQSVDGDWAGPFGAMEEALKSLMSR